jgi:hypothetical protein
MDEVGLNFFGILSYLKSLFISGDRLETSCKMN